MNKLIQDTNIESHEQMKRGKANILDEEQTKSKARIKRIVNVERGRYMNYERV